MPSRRDRRGRGPRGLLVSDPHPARSTREARFERIVARGADRLRRRHPELAEVRFAIDTVPLVGPTEEVPLGRIYPAVPGRAAHIVIFRRPLESRCSDPSELETAIETVLRHQTSLLLGISEDDL